MDLSHLSVRQRRFAEDNLYSFTGLKYQCVRAWFDNIEMVADMIHEAHHSVLLKFAVHNLIDGSERWYKTHEHNLTTWSDFKQRMIKQFDTRIPPSGTDCIVSSQTPMKERRRAIAWHPQHVAHYKSYHSKKSSVVDHQPALSVPHFSMFQLDPFEVIWPPGDQSWVDTEPKPQRSNFALKPRQELIHNLIADAVYETQPQLRQESLYVERSLPAVNFNIQAKSDSFWPDGIESWHIHEIRPQRQLFVNRIDPEPSIIIQESLVKRKNHPVERALQLNPNLPVTVLKVDQISFPPETPTPYSHNVFDMDTCLKKSLRFPDMAIVWTALKLQPYQSAPKLYDLSNGLVRSSHVVLHPPSKTQPFTQLSRLINVRFALLLLFLLTVLTRYGIVHKSSHLLNSVPAHSAIFELFFIAVMIHTICSNHPRHSKPYVKTIETLRKLESLLIYPIT
jgi:hypothetical protein